MDALEKILKTIDEAIANFQEKMPGLQIVAFDELQPLIKQLRLSGGRILSNVENLKLLGTIKNKLQGVFGNSEYEDSVQEFITAYDALATLNMQYFKAFNQEFTPAKTLPLIKDLAVESTVNDLIGQGMNVNLVDPVTDILKTSITTGGSYADLSSQLRDNMIGNDQIEGSLVKYSKQITIDAIHQYQAQYHAAIAQDLNFNWGEYVGSLIETSRQFCILLTAKRWVHKSELPGIIAGDIDGHKCTLNKKTHLPLGMIAGTNEINFVVNRGGYQCGHHYFMVPDNVVPAYLLAKFPKNS